MKKFLLIAASAAFVLSATATHAEVRFVNLGNKQLNEKRTATLARINRATDETRLVWKPGHQVVSHWTPYWDEVTQTDKYDWTVTEDQTFTYTDEGRIATMKNANGDEIRYEYDAEGRLTTETRYNDNGDAYEKREYAYDTVVKNLIVRSSIYNFEANEWKLMSEETTEITRNSDNNITQISEFSSYNGNKTEQQRVVYTYGANKKINTIKLYYYDGEEGVEMDAEMTDIKWVKTNGQLIDLEFDELAYYFSENWIASATLPKATNEPYLGDIFVKFDYKPGLGGFTMTQTMNNEVIVKDEFTITDTFGSYTERDFSVDFDNDGDDTWFRDGEDLCDYTKVYDKFGLVLLDKEVNYEDANPEKADWTTTTTGKVEYDADHGYPVEYTSAYENTESQNGPQNQVHIVWSDYKSFEAGIGAIATDNENAPVEYFDLRGQRVDNPANGFFIRRQGNNVEKIVVR